MKIRLVSHASVIIECSDLTLWTDPWLLGKAFNESWLLFPPACFDDALLDEIDYGQARTLWATVVNVPLTDLERLRLARTEQLESDVEQVLSAAGLMTAMESSPDVTWGGPQIRDASPLRYVVSERGALLLRILDDF